METIAPQRDLRFLTIGNLWLVVAICGQKMWRKMCVKATRHPESLVPVHLGKAFGLARPEEARVRPAVVAHAHAGRDCITRNGASVAGSTLLTIRSREDRGT